MQNIDQYLEQKLVEISISEDEIAKIKKKIKDFFDIIENYFPQICGYAFGGSFDRYTAIPNYYDIDLYFIFAADSIKPLSGKKMLKELFNILSQLETNDPEDEMTPFYIRIKIAEQYYHSIPITLDHIKLDCLAAIEIPEHPHSYYIPNADKVDISKPKLIEDRVCVFNKHTNGMGNKLIRLLKLWNYTHGNNFKSFQLELLCCYIFRVKTFDSLRAGIDTFMSEGLRIIQVNETSFNLWMLKQKIKWKAINQIKDTQEFIGQNMWEKLFE